MARDAIKSRSAFAIGSGFFRNFNFLPLPPHAVHVFHIHITEHVRMSPHEFIGNAARDLFKIKRAALFRHLRVEHNLQ